MTGKQKLKSTDHHVVQVCNVYDCVTNWRPSSLQRQQQTKFCYYLSHCLCYFLHSGPLWLLTLTFKIFCSYERGLIFKFFFLIFNVLMTLEVSVTLVFHMLLTLSNTYAADISCADEFFKYLQQLCSHRMLRW
jgi:hypothetical protein